MAKGLLDPNMMALLGAASGLLGASGYSARPISMGEAMGRGLQGGMAGYQQGMVMQQQQIAQQQAQLKSHMEQQAMQRKMEQQVQKRFLASGGAGSYADNLMNSGVPDLIEEGRGIRGKVKSSKTVMGPDGKPYELPMYEDGSFGEPATMATAAKLEGVNLGGSQAMLDPFTGKVVASHGTSITPGQAAALAQSRQQFGASHGLAQQRLEMDRGASVLDRATAEAKLQKLRQGNDPAYQADLAATIYSAKSKGARRESAIEALPNLEITSEQRVADLEELKNHPGFDSSVGANSFMGALGSYIPGTPAADFASLRDKVNAGTYLQGIKEFKGMGALTDAEGRIGAEALGIIGTGTSEEGTKAAIDTLIGLEKKALAKTREMAGASAGGSLPAGFTLIGVE